MFKVKRKDLKVEFKLIKENKEQLIVEVKNIDVSIVRLVLSSKYANVSLYENLISVEFARELMEFILTHEDFKKFIGTVYEDILKMNFIEPIKEENFKEGFSSLKDGILDELGYDDFLMPVKSLVLAEMIVSGIDEARLNEKQLKALNNLKDKMIIGIDG